VLIAAGTTVTVTEGTQLQFFSADPEDPYSQYAKPYLQVEGTLNVQGNAEAPVEMFTGLQWQSYPILIRQVANGSTTLRYTRVANPVLGSFNNFYNNNSYGQPLDLMDHVLFSQDDSNCIMGFNNQSSEWSECTQSPIVNAADIEHSIFHKIGYSIELEMRSPISTNLFIASVVDLRSISFGNVFLKNYGISNNTIKPSHATAGHLIHEPSFLRFAFPTQYEGKTYVAVAKPPNYSQDSGDWNYLDDIETFANQFGGHVVAINNAEENQFLSDYRNNILTQDAFYAVYTDMDCGSSSTGGVDDCWDLFSSFLTIGLTNNNPEKEYRWVSGEPLDYTNWASGEPTESLGEKRFVFLHTSNNQWYDMEHMLYPLVVELPGTITETELENARQEMIDEGHFNDFTDNAILNIWWDPDVNHWMRFYMDGTRDHIRYIHNNFWGTTSTTLIDAAIHDFNDDFNLGAYQYQPILTEPPETAYPFVTSVVLSTDGEPDTLLVGAEPVTFTVTFNRDMDTGIQPMVSFGPAEPFTDFIISGDWVDPRTWQGTFTITPVTGDGYQLIRVAGAVAADDPWLVTGDDAGRFRFEVITSGTEAMNLQATGGEGYVDLMWTQTDFDLLAGFNLYRSTSIDGTYTRINSSIIPPETRDYRDTDVAPGQPYYYKFTVVKSDMTESDFSNTATATPLDTIPPVLTHTPVTSAEPGQHLTLSATATDNVNVANVTLYYRHVGDATYTSIPMVNTTGDSYYATIEGSLLSSPGIEYYIEASDGISITRNGRAEDPNLVSVIDRPVVTIVTPNSGPSEGGTAVTISGSNFKDGATVTFGGMAASNMVFVSSSQITCTTPGHIPETVDVRVTNPDAQYGLLLNGFTFVSTAAQISMPNTGGGTGNIVTVPVNAANINGMLAASLTVNFDPAVLSVQFASTGTLTAGWAFASNLLAPGQYRLSMSSTSGVSGSGTLANIEFEVIGEPGTTSALTISNILLNDGAITVELTDGLFSVDDVYNVSGLVSYWNGGAPVPGTTLTLTGDQVYSALSGADGNYTIQGAAIDAYTLTPSKSDGDNEISAYDASFALQHDVGIITLSGNQAIAADVNSNGVINSMDAAYILQKSADLISLPFPGSGVVWKFNPSSREIADLTDNITGQDFTAVLLGDISGNWTDPGEPAQATVEETRAASAVLTIPDATVLPDGTADIPLSLDITDAELLGADIVFTYDPTHIAVSDVRLGTLAAGWSHASNLTEPGVVKIAMAGAMPITTSGELVLFTVTALGASGTQSALTLTQGELNERTISTELHSGFITIDNGEVPPNHIYLPLIIN
jgi:hypothetical protein